MTKKKGDFVDKKLIFFVFLFMDKKEIFLILLGLESKRILRV